VDCTRALTCVGLLMAMLTLPCFGQQSPAAVTIKVKIEANQWDSGLILKKLNDHGADHGMKFEVGEEGFEYRITFATGQHKNTLLGLAGAGAVNYSKAGVTAYDAKGNELFNFERENRYTDSGATNAAAKEIIKRLRKLRQPQKK
jgi:hypothetical protein